MPTLAKAHLVQSDSPWRAAYDRMYLELRHHRADILTALGFYAERDLLPRKIQTPRLPSRKKSYAR